MIGERGGHALEDTHTCTRPSLVFAHPVEDRLRQPFGTVLIHIVLGAFCHQDLRRAYASGELGGERRRGKHVMLARDEEHGAGDVARF